MNLIISTLFCILVSCGIYQGDQDSFFDKFKTQELYNTEIHPTGSTIDNGFDATLEEVLHLVTQHGYAYAYPNTFGEIPGSTIATYMDDARGGYFIDVPNTYPSTSWYHYNDTTCDYSCQITEYFYWALTSILGAQDYNNGAETREEQIDDEWELNTATKMQNGDPNMYALMTSGSVTLPTTIPNGNYAKSADLGLSIETSLPAELSDISAYFSKYMSVFGIHIVATEQVDDNRLLHTAYVLAEYLDNNEDGTVDDPAILDNIINQKAMITITADSDEMERIYNSLN